jgi:hypothetical protein
MTICLPVPASRGNRAAGRAVAPTWPLLLCALLAGCKSGIDASALQDQQDARINQMASTDDIHGPMERFMKAAGFSK